MIANKKLWARIAIGVTAISLSLSIQVRAAHAIEIQEALSTYWVDFKSFLDQQLDQVLSKKEIPTAVEGIVGELGMPAPDKVQEQVQQQSEAGAFAVYPTAQAEATTLDVKHAIAEALIAAELGEEGQKQTKTEIDSVAQAASETLQAAAQAQSTNVTQDILKQIATQNTQSTSILQATHQELVKTRIATLQSNESLLSISKNLDQQEWDREIDVAASQAGLVNAAAQFATLISSKPILIADE